MFVRQKLGTWAFSKANVRAVFDIGSDGTTLDLQTDAELLSCGHLKLAGVIGIHWACELFWRGEHVRDTIALECHHMPFFGLVAAENIDSDSFVVRPVTEMGIQEIFINELTVLENDQGASCRLTRGLDCVFCLNFKFREGNGPI